MVRAYSRCKFIFHQQFNREQRTLHFNFIPGICDFFFFGGGGGEVHILKAGHSSLMLGQ